MIFSFDTYTRLTSNATKIMKFFGDNIGKIQVVLGIGVAAAGANTIPKEIEKHNTTYEYKEWIIYKKGKYIYAEKDNNRLKVEGCEFRKIEQMIDKL